MAVYIVEWKILICSTCISTKDDDQVTLAVRPMLDMRIFLAECSFLTMWRSIYNACSQSVHEEKQIFGTFSFLESISAPPLLTLLLY